MIGRRGFITGLVSLVAAPAIVRAGSLMPVKVVVEPPKMITLAEWAKSFGEGPMMQAIRLMEAERLVNPPWLPYASRDEQLECFLRVAR